MRTGLTFLWCTFLSLSVFGQQDSVYGHIFSYEGETLIGANISLKGEVSGTISDIDGQYQLLFPASSSRTVAFTFTDDGRRPFSTEVIKGQKTDAFLRDYYYPEELRKKRNKKKRNRKKDKIQTDTLFTFKGQLLDHQNQALVNVSIRVEQDLDQIVQTDSKGWFKIRTPLNAKGLIVVHTQTEKEEGTSGDSRLVVSAKIIY